VLASFRGIGVTAAVPRGHLAALGILVAMVTLSGVWASSLQGCDEAYYAHMARGMLESGDFLVPRYDGTPPLDKPPLLMWLVAASFRFFGVGDVQARLPVLLLGAAVPFAVWWGIPQTAAFRFVAASTLATTLLYVQLQHMVMTDLVAFVGLLGLVVGLLRAAEGERWGWVAGSGLGVAALAKGPLAALFVLATLPYAVRHREELLRSGFLARAIPGILPAAAWYGLVWREFGQKFVDVHFGVFLFRLAAQGIAAESPLGPAFYLVSALWRFLPWWPLLPAALVAGWGAARAKDRTAEWSVGFAAVYFTAITAMRTKTDHYALPLVLPAALLVAGWVTGGGGFRTAESLSAVLCRVLGGLLAFGAPVAAAGLLPAPLQLRLPAAALSLLVAWAVVRCGNLVRGGERQAAWSSVLWPVVLAYAVAGVALRPWDAEPGLRTVAKALPAGEAVVYVAGQPLSQNSCPYLALRFRLDRPPRVISPAEFPSAPPGWYVGRTGELVPNAQDRVVVRSDWVLVHRP